MKLGESMRVINFNIKGARAPGRKDHATQERSWHLLAAYNADIALVQEVGAKAIPDWVRQKWTIVQGDPSIFGNAMAGWGSVIAARPSLNLVELPTLREHPSLRLIYDYAVFGEIDLPDKNKAIISSVHAPARRLQQYLELMGFTNALTSEEMITMGQPGDTPWALDLIFAEIAKLVDNHRFIVGGDWNNSRLFDLHPELRKRGQLPFSTMFFTRAYDAGWRECHGMKNEERSYLNPRSQPHQLDHLFCDKVTYEKMTDCSVRADWVVYELSDHAPLVTDFKWL
jgi:exonuclease III